MSTFPQTISVAEAMARPAFYPGHPPVTVRETHTARVFLAGDRAYKVKKPVRMAFLDFSTLEGRRRVCEEELRVNRELAAPLEMRLRAIVPLEGSYALADPDTEEAVEYALVMRRFDEQGTMAALVERGELDDEQVRAVARRLAGFHDQAQPAVPAGDPAGDVKRTWDHNMRELLAIADDETARRALAADRFAGAFVLAHRDALRARARAGRIRDGHGDLRAEHVVLSEPLMIVDRLEFNAALREIDVADDLAFLAMDLQRLGAADAARLLVAAYRDAGGDSGDDALLAYYGAYRALVRAKVDLLRAAQLAGNADAAPADDDDDVVDAAQADAGADAAAARAARADADALLDLAERLAWRARGPLVLAIGGPPASGKSTLAAELARRSGWSLLSSDALRKRRRGLELRDRAPDADYTPAARAAVYRELGERARASSADGDGVIVDATFGDPRLRAAFLAGLGDGSALLRAVECHAPAALRARWAAERSADGARGSDATAPVAARLAADYSGWDELAETAMLTVRPGAGAGRGVAQIADWLDTDGSVVCPAGTRPATDAARTMRA